MARKAPVAKKSGAAKPSGMKIKKGDHVIVIAGRDNGREGTVIAAFPEQQKLLVQGVNMIKKNTKVDYQGRRGAKEGGIIHQEALIHVSNVQLIDPDTKKPARAGYRRDDDTSKKVRISRQSGKDI
jgi:large subunit ribosomal protein L24